MATKIDIASNALVLIGDDPISSFDDPGAGAQAANSLYEDTYKSVLSTHPFTFALKEVFLNKLSQSPDDLTNYSNAFQLPPDKLRVWKIMPHSNYDIVGDIVYSNENSLLCRYVYRVTEAKLSSEIIKAIEYKLASEFAMPVTESETKAAFYEKKYFLQLAVAQSVDSQGKPQVAIVDSPFVDVRGGGFGYGGY